MILIIEGIDKAGKSSVISDIRDLQKDAIVFKLANKPKDGSIEQLNRVYVAYVELFAQAVRLSNEGRLIIFDRAYPSEMVYSVKRGYDALLDSPKWRKFDKVLSNEHALVIYCYAPKEIIEKRFETDKEEFMSVKEIDEFTTRYEHFLGITELPYIKVDSTKDRAANITTIRQLLQ